MNGDCPSPWIGDYSIYIEGRVRLPPRRMCGVHLHVAAPQFKVAVSFMPNVRLLTYAHFCPRYDESVRLLAARALLRTVATPEPCHSVWGPYIGKLMIAGQ